MKRRLRPFPILQARALLAARIAGLVLLGVLGVFGVRALFHGGLKTETASAPAAPDSLLQIDPGAFHGMRPRAADRMTAPRVGFRWVWTPDSARAAVPSAQVTFRLHLISSDGAQEITHKADEPRTQLNLPETFPYGECQWWVEAAVPGFPPVRSAKETFLLEQ